MPAQTSILIVEDEVIAAEHESRILKGLGYAVPAIASHGDEAIQKAEELRPSLVLMDIKLPGGMDGIEAAVQIMQRFNIPVVYLTAQSGPATQVRIKKSGAFGCLIKPFRASDLHHAIEIALYKHEMEQKLRESEEKYRALFESVSDGIFIYDPDTTHILDANQATSEMYGYDRDELIGMSCLKFSAEVEKSSAAIERIREAGEVSVPNRYHQKKDGTIFPVEINGYSITLGGKKVMFAVSRDMSKNQLVVP